MRALELINQISHYNDVNVFVRINKKFYVIHKTSLESSTVMPDMIVIEAVDATLVEPESKPWFLSGALMSVEGCIPNCSSLDLMWWLIYPSIRTSEKS